MSIHQKHTIFYNIKDLLFPKKEDFQQEFNIELSYKLSKLGLVISSLIILFEIYNLVFIGLLNLIILPLDVRHIYINMYIILLIISVIFFIRFLRYVIMGRKQPGRHILIEQSLYSFIILLWSTGITILDQRTTHDVSVYICAVLSIAAVTYIEPRYSILMFTANHLILLSFFSMFQKEAVSNTGIYINTTIITILAIVSSVSRYRNKYSDFKNHLIIKKQNEKINSINERLNKKSITDELTGLYNRSFMNDVLPKLYLACESQHYLFTVFMIDVDDFKSFNDHYGHPAGDECLRQVASCLKEVATPYTDCIIRYGGEEFLILIMNQSLEKTDAAADELLKAVRNLQIVNASKNRMVTVSIGIFSGYTSASKKIEDFIKYADEALYQAKIYGKNQIARYNNHQ